MSGEMLLAGVMLAVGLISALYTEWERLALRVLWREIRTEYKAMEALEVRLDALVEKKKGDAAAARLNNEDGSSHD